MIDPTKRMAELTPEKRKLVAQKLQKKLLSQQLQKNKDGTVSRAQILPQERKTNVFPLSFAQNRLWFLHQLEPQSAFYNVPLVFRLTGELRIDALERCLAKVVQRHEVLRTTFHMQQEQPVQVISSSLPIQIVVLDLQDLPAAQGTGSAQGTGLGQAQSASTDSQAVQLAEQEARRPFDLTQGPLLRVSLLRLRRDSALGLSVYTDETRRDSALGLSEPLQGIGLAPIPTTAPQEHILLLTLHHIVCDDWSIGILVREIALLYQAEIDGEVGGKSPDRGKPYPPSIWPELPIQYADYTHWQREFLQGEVLQSQLAYWRKQLAGAPALLQFPTDRPRPAVQRYGGAFQSRLLSPELLQQLKSLSQQEGTTLFITTLSIFQILLMRYSAQTDIVVGTPMANRMREELEGLIGFFVNTLVLRTDLSGNPSFLQLLARVHEVALQAYMHQDIPFEKLVEELQPKRDLSYQPLFQVLFSLENAPHPSIELPGLSFRPLPVKNDTAKFDLSLKLTEVQAGLQTVVEYNTDLFDDATITHLLGHWQVLLEAIVRDPGQPIEMLPLLTEQEHQQLLLQGNAKRIAADRLACATSLSQATTDITADLCLHQLFERQVELTPDAIAVVFNDVGTVPCACPGFTPHLTYSQLNSQANQLASYLRQECTESNRLVGVYMERSIELVIALLAVLKAEGTYVPLDPGYPQERIISMLEDAQVSVVLTHKLDDSTCPVGQAHWLPASHLHIICLDENLPHRDHRACPNGQLDTHEVRQITREHLAYMIYTSGSTGRPKGAGVSHRSLVNLLNWFLNEFHITAQDRMLIVTSPSFDLTQKDLFAPLMVGGMIHVQPAGYDVMLVRQSIAEQGITLLNCTPSMFYPLVNDDQDDALAFLISLRSVFLGGEPIALPRLWRWIQAPQRSAELVNTYGPTECTDVVAFYRIEQLDQWRETAVPIGYPIWNTQLLILDQKLQLVPPLVAGELYVAGAAVGAGYVHDAALTAAKFLPNPFGGTMPCAGPGTRLYKTGDLVRYRPNGAIEYLGRIDNQVKLRGFRIELGEIEATLQAHPAVQEAVVVLRELGQEGGKPLSDRKYLVAYVTRAPSSLSPRFGESLTAVGAGQAHADRDKPQSLRVPTAPALQGYLRERLPDYMVPTFVVFLESMPLNPSGKVDRKSLPSPTISAHHKPTFVAPRSRVEQILVTVWQQVLEVGTQIGIHDNFFELGGDSILSLQMIGRVRQAGLQLTPKQVFQHQTIAQLATVAIPLLESRRDSGLPLSVSPESGTRRDSGLPLSVSVPLREQTEVVGPVPLTPIQQWFFEQNLSQPQHSNQSIMLLVPSSWKRRYLQQVLDALLVHHDALRLRFEETETGWHQRTVNVAEAGAMAVVQIDLTQVEASNQSHIIEQVANCAQASLDLKCGPLLRVLLFELGNGQPARLLVASHHMTIDGVSWRVLIEDFQLAMTQLQRNEPIALPAKTVSFQHWAEHLQELAQSALLQKERTYWLRAAQVPTVPLPLDWAEGSNTEADARIVNMSLTIEETRLLLQEVPRSYGSNIQELLLTAVVQTLAHWVGSQQIRLDMEGHGREELGAETLDVSRTMGWFTSIYPMLFTLPQQGGCGEWIKTIKEHMQSVPHKGIGYGLLRYCSHRTGAVGTGASPALRGRYFRGRNEHVGTGVSLANHARSEDEKPLSALAPSERVRVTPTDRGFSFGCEPLEAERNPCPYEKPTPERASPVPTAPVRSLYGPGGDPELRERLASASPSQVCFNYQGQFDQVRSRPSEGEEALEVAPESCGATGGPQNQRRYLLELIALVVGGQLCLEWVYSEQLYRPTTIERLADGVAHALRELLAYCIDETRRQG